MNKILAILELWINGLKARVRPYFTGLKEDLRSAEEKKKDYLHKEVSEGPRSVEWVEKKPEEWRKFPIRDQKSSYSCVGQSIAKLLGIENYVEENKFVNLSALDIYDRRINKPEPGMGGDNALQVASKYGACLEEQLPSQNMNEEQMNVPVYRSEEMKATAALYRASNYIKITPSYDIDTIASIIRQGKGVMLFLEFNYDEWKDVFIIKRSKTSLRHAVVVVDYTLWNGEKALVIEDSAGNFKLWPGQRIITESFLKKRCYYAGYLLHLANDPTLIARTKKPHHKFTEMLQFGQDCMDVVALQNILRFEGFFPANIKSTGYYGAITAKAVLAWQVKHGVAGDTELNRLQGKYVGEKTIAKLNELYA